MRILSFIFAAILVVGVLAALLLPSFFDLNSYKQQIKDTVQDKTDLILDINGDIELAILPTPYVYAQNISLRSPRSVRGEPLLTMDQASVNLDVGALLGGQIKLDNVELKKPVVLIETLKSGKQSWQTEKLQALMNNENAGADEVQDNASSSPSFDVSVTNLNIEDGSFVLYNESTDAETRLSGIQLDVQADTLSGPFYAKGETDFSGQTIAFEAKTGRLDTDSETVAVNATVRADAYNSKIGFSGVIETGDQIEVQGETTLSLSDLPGLLENQNIDAPWLAMKDAEIKGLLTATPEQVNLTDGAMITAGKTMPIAFSAQLAPLKGQFALNGSNVSPYTLVRYDPFQNFASFSVAGTFSQDGDAITLSDVRIALDEQTLTGRVSYISAQRPKIQANINADNLNLDKILPQNDQAAADSKAQKKAAEFNPKDAAQSLKLPFDVEAALNARNLQYQGNTLSQASLQAVVNENSANIQQFSLSGYMNSDISGAITIQNIDALSGINGRVQVQSPDLPAVMNALNVNAGVPEGFKTLNGSAQFSGAAENLTVTANVKSGGATLIIKASDINPLEPESIDAATVQVQHGNTNQFLSMLSGSPMTFPSLNGPLDAYANMGMKDQAINLNNLTVSLAAIRAKGNLSVATGAAKPAIQGKLNFGDTVWESAATQSSGGGGSNGAANNSGGSHWSPAPLNNGWMHQANIDLDIAAESLKYGNWDLSQPSIQFTLKDGVLTIEQLNAGLYEGQINLSATAQSPAQNSSNLNVKSAIKIRDVALEPFISSFASSRILKGKGFINLDGNFQAGGSSAQGLVNSLQGNGVMTGRDFVLEGLDLTRFARALSSDLKPGDSALGLWKGTTSGGSTVFNDLDGEYVVQGGVVTLKKMALDGPEAFIDTTGTINLPAYTLSTAHEITIKNEDVPPFTIRLSGPLSNPAQTFGQGLIQDYISRKINRKVGKVIEDKVGGELGKALGGFLGVPSQTQGTSQTNGDNTQNMQGGDNSSSAAPTTDEGAANPAPANDTGDPREKAIKGLLKGILQ